MRRTNRTAKLALWIALGYLGITLFFVLYVEVLGIDKDYFHWLWYYQEGR